MNNSNDNSSSPSPFSKALITLIPLVILGILLVVIFEFIFDLIEPISLMLSPGSEEPHWVVHIISALILALLVLLLGLALQSDRGKKAFKWLELNIFIRLPFYSSINDIVKRFSGIKDMPFSRVVLIDPFDSGAFLTGFVVDDCEDEILTVFVPTAPNPTNGNIYHVKNTHVKFVDITPREAMQTIIGLGTGTSKLFKNIIQPENHDKIAAMENQ